MAGYHPWLSVSNESYPKHKVDRHHAFIKAFGFVIYKDG